MWDHTPDEPPTLGGYDPLIDKEIRELAHKYWEERGASLDRPRWIGSAPLLR